MLLKICLTYPCLCSKNKQSPGKSRGSVLDQRKLICLISISVIMLFQYILMCHLIHRKLVLVMRAVPSSTPTQVCLFQRFKDASGSVRRGKKPQNSPGVKYLVFGNGKGGNCQRENTLQSKPKPCLSTLKCALRSLWGIVTCLSLEDRGGSL